MSVTPMSTTKDDFLGHWSEAAINQLDRTYISIEHNVGNWEWTEYNGTTQQRTGQVSFSSKGTLTATLTGHPTYTSPWSIVTLPDDHKGIEDSKGTTLRLTTCVAIFSIEKNASDQVVKSLTSKVGFPEAFKVNGQRIEVPTGATLLVRYNLEVKSYAFKTGGDWINWLDPSKQPNAELMRLADQSVAMFDKTPATAGDEYSFNLSAIDESGGPVDLDPLLIIKAPEGL